MNDGKCSGPECEKDAFCKELCRGHYRQMHDGEQLRPLRARQAKGETPDECSLEGCDRPHHSKGWCQSHYYQWKRHGVVQAFTVFQQECSVLGCGRPHSAHGLCDGHNIQRRAGKELTPLRIRQLGRTCSVDGCNEPRLARDMCVKHYNQWHWAKSAEGRAARQRAFRKRRAAKQFCETFTVLPRDRRRMIHRYRGLCAYCQVRPWSHWDHVIPLSRGGRESIGNLLPACASCNPAKKARLLTEWKKSGARLRTSRRALST